MRPSGDHTAEVEDEIAKRRGPGDPHDAERTAGTNQLSHAPQSGFLVQMVQGGDGRDDIKAGCLERPGEEVPVQVFDAIRCPVGAGGVDAEGVGVNPNDMRDLLPELAHQPALSTADVEGVSGAGGDTVDELAAVVDVVVPAVGHGPTLPNSGDQARVP